MDSTTQRRTVIAPTSPSAPRLLLASGRASHAVLDGGWWPHSWDPVAELPGLVLALSARYGPIRQVMLNGGTWDGRFRRLAVGADVVRMGWFASVDPAVLIATTDSGEQVDLLVVPPATVPAAAERAMAIAADPDNGTRAPAILASLRAAPTASAVGDGRAAWDNEGGSQPVAAAAPARR
jgi:hypothetical protein